MQLTEIVDAPELAQIGKGSIHTVVSQRMHHDMLSCDHSNRDDLAVVIAEVMMQTRNADALSAEVHLRRRGLCWMQWIKAT